MNKVFPTDLPNISNRMHECGAGNYWYFHMGSFPGDPPLYYQQLIAAARSKIEIWDPYVHITNSPSDLEMFDHIPSNLTLKVLTKKGLTRTNATYLSDFHLALKARVSPTKNLRFGLRVIDTSDSVMLNNWCFHDRFLIIDDSDIFILGSSIGWHVKAHESTGIFKIGSVDSKAFIRSLFDEYWKQAARKEIPIQYLHP
jgi:hypothetical protein